MNCILALVLPPLSIPLVGRSIVARHITGGAETQTFQPMNVNFGLFPPIDAARSGRRCRRDRYKALDRPRHADFAA